LSKEPSDSDVRVTAEEHSRPVFRLLARAALLLAQAKPAPDAEPAEADAPEDGNEKGGQDG
jgi:hypothetical protein